MKPKKSEVIYHFKNAKEVRCVKSGAVIKIEEIVNPVFYHGAYTISNGNVTLWYKNQFAPITKRKPNKKCQCNDCNCQDKNKIVKRKPIV